MDLKLAAGFFVMELEHREDKNSFEFFYWWVRTGVTGYETEKEFEDSMKIRGNSSDMTRWDVDFVYLFRLFMWKLDEIQKRFIGYDQRWDYHHWVCLTWEISLALKPKQHLRLFFLRINIPNIVNCNHWAVYSPDLAEIFIVSFFVPIFPYIIILSFLLIRVRLCVFPHLRINCLSAEIWPWK